MGKSAPDLAIPAILAILAMPHIITTSISLGMRASGCFAWCVLAAVAAGGRLAVAQNADRRQLERVEETLRLEGQAIVALADLPAASHADPIDFALTWHNDFLKAQSGTFVPFTVGIAPPDQRMTAVLLYVRVARRARDEADKPGERRRTGAAVVPETTTYPFEGIYPVDLTPGKGHSVRITKGFSVSPGSYDLTVVVREREREADRGRRRLAAVLRQPLNVPDYSAPGLSTSTVIVADRLTVLPQPAPGDLSGHPYVIGGREIEPAADAVYGRNEELIVLFLVYNPAITTDKLFDLEVEYHFFRKNGQGAATQGVARGDRPVPAALPGETYFNRTEPQRFTPSVLGPQFDPAAGQPVMAGQGISLAGFQEGEYRLAIRVTDLVSGQSVERQVIFTVRS
jgi:hypothetical protein